MRIFGNKKRNRTNYRNNIKSNNKKTKYTDMTNKQSISDEEIAHQLFSDTKQPSGSTSNTNTPSPNTPTLNNKEHNDTTPLNNNSATSPSPNDINDDKAMDEDFLSLNQENITPTLDDSIHKPSSDKITSLAENEKPNAVDPENESHDQMIIDDLGSQHISKNKDKHKATLEDSDGNKTVDHQQIEVISDNEFADFKGAEFYYAFSILNKQQTRNINTVKSIIDNKFKNTSSYQGIKGTLKYFDIPFIVVTFSNISDRDSIKGFKENDNTFTFHKYNNKNLKQVISTYLDDQLS